MTGGTSIGMPEVIAALMVVALNAYVLTGGADFGGGVWDLFARGPRRAEQRALIAHEIGPIWEANHVWLILVVVMLFTAFPVAFALLGTVLHIPLSLMLVGIVMRGSSFVFRSYGARDGASQRRWGTIFAIASIGTPVLLGVIVGAIASGRVARAAARLSVTAPAPPSFASVYVEPWLSPFPLVLGLLALAMFAFLAATYLTAAATDDALRDDFRRHAYSAAAMMFVAAFGALGVAHSSAPELRRGLMSFTRGALALQIATALAAIVALGALAARRWLAARVAAGAQASLILWGWVLVQYPFIIPPIHTARDVAAPRATLVLLLGALTAGAVVLVPSLAYLYRTFAPAKA